MGPKESIQQPALSSQRERAFLNVDFVPSPHTIESRFILRIKLPSGEVASVLHEGDKAPQFSTLDSNGRKVNLNDFKGKNVVLYFFPKANTPGCTLETCDFRDEYNSIQKRAVILGMSADSLKAQSNFSTKYHVPFPLLCDEDRKILKAYGVWKEKSLYGRNFMGIERTTFIIDKNGFIQKIFSKVKVKGHVAEVLESLK